MAEADGRSPDGRFKVGGRRPGAGRPRKPVKVLKKATAELLLSELDEVPSWKWAWETAKEKKDVKTCVEILSYLTDRRDGRPSQAVALGGTEGQPLEVVFGGTLPPWAAPE